MDYIWERMDVVDGEPSEKILIIARNYRYAQEWCRVHEINWNSRNVKIVTRDILGVHGITGSYYVDLGTDSPDVRELVERLKSLDAIRPLLCPNI